MSKAVWLTVGILGVAGYALAQAPAPADAGKAPGRGPGGQPPLERGPRMAVDPEGMFMRWLAQDPKAAQNLGLTPEQIKDIKAALSSSSGDMTELTGKMQKAAEQQIGLMSQDAPDEAAVMKLVDEIGRLRSDIAKLQMKQMLAVLKTLTPEQRAKLREMTKNRIDEAKGRWNERRALRRDGQPKAGGDAAPQPPPPPPPPPQQAPTAVAPPAPPAAQ